MEIAIKWRNISNKSEITLSFLQNRVNGRIFRTGLLLPTMKLAYIALGAEKEMEIAYKRRNIANKSEIALSFLQNGVNGRIIHTVGIDPTLKTACVAFSVYNAMEIAFKRRNIFNRIDITLSFLQNVVNGRILRTVGIDSTLKAACVAFGV